MTLRLVNGGKREDVEKTEESKIDMAEPFASILRDLNQILAPRPEVVPTELDLLRTELEMISQNWEMLVKPDGVDIVGFRCDSKGSDVVTIATVPINTVEGALNAHFIAKATLNKLCH